MFCLLETTYWSRIFLWLMCDFVCIHAIYILLAFVPLPLVFGIEKSASQPLTNIEVLRFWSNNLMSMLNGLKKEMCGMLGDMEILIWEKCMFRYPVKNYLKHIRNLILVFILFLFNRCTLVHVSQLNNFNCKLNIHIRLRKMGSLTYALI